MWNLAAPEHLRNPYPFYEQYRGTPVCRLPGSELWAVFGYGAARSALLDTSQFTSCISGPGARTSRWLIFSDPPRHTKLRALIASAFSARVVAELEARIVQIARELLEPKLPHGELDLVNDFALPLPLRVIVELLGSSPDDLATYRGWSDAMLALAATLIGGPEAEQGLARFSAASLEMEAYLVDLVRMRVARPRNDLLSRLASAEVEGERLTQSDLLGFFQLLLLAGHETTTNLISNAVLCLLEHPQALASLLAQPQCMRGVVEEVLRFRSPVQVVFRRTRGELVLAGTTIPDQSVVLLFLGAANRDPTCFVQPDRFDVTRSPNPHLAFGHGAHFCLGANLARLEARLALCCLFEHVESFEPRQSSWQPRQAFHIHGPESLHLRFNLRR